MDTEKKPEQSKNEHKPDISQVLGDLLVSGATVLAHCRSRS